MHSLSRRAQPICLKYPGGCGRDRAGTPRHPPPIGGDPVPVSDTVEREWFQNNPGQPSPFDPDDLALLALANMERQNISLRIRLLRKYWIGQLIGPRPRA